MIHLLRSQCSKLVVGFFAVLFLCRCINANAQPPKKDAQTQVQSDDEEKERVAAERFLEVLIKRPTTGTALDRVFGYHVAKGDIGEVVRRLSTKATESKDADESGRHWLLVGLLQLQRSEDAAAVLALSKAQAKLATNPLAAFHHGQALLLIGDTDSAAAALQTAIDRKPAKADYLAIGGQLGRLYQRAGKVDAAIKVWNELERTFPNDDGVRHRIAATLAEEGDLKGALERYDALAKTAKAQNDQMVFAISAADLRIQLGQKEQATKDLEGLLSKLRPNSYLYDDARRRIETAFLSSGDYAGLASYYERWVADHKEDIDAILRLARVLSVQGRSEEALKWFEDSIERAPTNTAPRLAIIDAYLADSRYADAATQYEQLVASDSSNPDYLVRWGQVLMSDTTKTEAERQQAAASVWKRLAAAKPKDAAMQTQVADLMRGAKLTDEALAGYRTAISLAPEEPQHKEYLGEYLHQLGRKDEALEVWRSLAAGELRTRENLIRLSEVLHQFEQSDEALKILAEACTMRPKVHERLRYAELLRDAQQFDKALEQIEFARTEAETVDERDRVFASSVQTYQAAGQLPQRIESARQAAEKMQPNAPAASEQWRQLAVLLEANRQTQESLEAIDQAVAAAPTNIETLDIAARMFEEAGRLPLAIEKRRLLADTDRRFRSGHLQRLASLYIQSGNAAAAIAAGREMLSGAGGSVDAFKFYAELCGQAGREDERIDTLRRCLRLNPRSEDAQQLLATQLAEDFKTEQAIELYWKMLDAASDIEKRREVVKKLADLYLRTNRLDQLISRIELRGRESGDRRTAIDLVAAAYQQAGDLGLAREALEGLLRESGRDTLLLERLVGLAEQAGEIEKAIELQRQLLRLAPGRTAESRLASLLIDIGATEEAQAMWLSMVEKNTDAQQTASSIDRLFAAGESKVAIELCRKAIENRPEDWETRLKLAVLLAETGDWESAAKVSVDIRAFKFDDATLPEGTKQKPQKVSANGVSYQQLPIRMMRMQNIYELLQILDERYGFQPRTALPKPIDFGHAKMMAMYIKYRSEVVSGGDLNGTLAELERRANEQDANADTIWDWYETQSIASTAEQTSGIDFQDPSNWGALWRLAELDSSGEIALIQLFVNRQSYAGRSDLQVRLKPVADEKLVWLKAKADNPRESNPQSPYGGPVSWATIYATELRIADKLDDANTFSQAQVAKVVADGDATNLLGNLQYLSSYGTDDQLWSVMQKLLAADSTKLFQQQYGGKPAASMLSIFAQKNRFDEKLSKGANDKEYRQRLFQLCDALIATESQTPARRKAIRMTGIGGVRSTYRIVGGSYEQLQITFPPQGLGPEDDFVQALYSTNDLLKEYLVEWMEHLKQSELGASDRGQVMIKLVRASVMQWNEKTADAIAELKEAIDLATKKAPTLEPELRLMLADLLLRQDRKQEALQAIELLSVYDQNTMAIREFSAAKLATVLGDKQRAQAAAKRLFGVRLDTEAQMELAKLMRSLDMRELAADLVRRLRTRGGSNTDQLRTLLTYFQTQDEKEQAAEVAMELLQRTAPTRNSKRNQSRSITTAESQLRKTAIQTLATSGKLNALIEAAEKRLEQSPKSQRVRAELSELYAGAGKADKAAALFADSKSEDLSSTSGLEAAAKQFVAIGKMDAACDAYLKILRRKPQLFQNDFYEIKRPFDQTKRVGELADLVLEVGLKKFEGYRVSEICSNLLRENKDSARARKLYLAMLELPPTTNNAMYNLNNVLGNARSLLTDKATLEITVQYLIKCGKNPSNDWSTLFQGYSTGGDGRHNNATTSLVRAIAGNEEFCSLTENLVRESLKEKADWHEGKAWLGLLLTARKQYDEAKTLLAPLATKEMKPQPTYDALWLIGSLIDEHKPMQELAATMYDYAMSNTVTNRQNDFQYSLENRACKLMADLGKRERARELVLQAVEKIKKGPKRNFNNDAYEAYEQIRTVMSLMDMLASVNFPAEALRLARELDRSLFAKAGQYQQNLDTDFDKKQKELLEAVHKLGGLQTAATMIDNNPKGAIAIDFGITYGDSPFSQRGIQSLWIDLIEEVQDKEGLSKLVEQLKALSDNRKLDDSAMAAWAIAADVAGDRQPLRKLLSDWMTNWITNDLRLRQRLFILATLRLDRGNAKPDEERQMVDQLLTSVKEWDGADQLPLLAELGRQSLSRKDSQRAKALWAKVATLNGLTQLQMLDLALSAANAGFADLSMEVAAASAKASGPVAGNSEATSKTSSLGDLLGSNRTRAPASNQNRDEPDSAEVQLAKKIIELDETWSNKKISPELVTRSLVALTFTDSRRFRPLHTNLKTQNDRIAIDSVFDRLAKHAHEAKLSEKVLEQLKDNNATSHLLATIVLLRDARFGEAKTRLESIEAESLQGVPKELALQSLLLALEQAPCRKRAVELGIALLDQNKPSQQYSEIQPFDTFAMILLKHVINQNMQKDLLAPVANHYLELTQHDNSRYGGSYGFQRRASQLEEMAKLFLNKGNNDEALKYLGMRQPVFNMGTDQSLDWVGCWVLESLNSYTDRKYAYWVIANWTFDGDGALNNIKTIARRQRLPAWIPESVGGSYPTFPPVAEPTLPIATNYFFLAKLAQQSQQIDDLKKRYAVALEKDRAGAVEGLALALAAWQEPIPPELLEQISKRLDSIDPGQDRSAKGSMPFAEVQLASILADDENHAVWAKSTFNKAVGHALPLNRGYVQPWLSRFQYQRGWSEAAKLQPANQLTHWVSSVSASAHDYYEGDTPAIWVTDGDNRIDHVCGFGTDFMWFRYPLEGNFEFEVELPSGNWRESGVWYRGIRFASPAATYVDVQGDESRSWMRVSTQGLKDNDWNKYTVKAEGDQLSYSVNGNVVYRENQKSGTPWLALRSLGPRSTFARNIKFAGSPTIPSSVDLIHNGHMRGWTGVYYGQPLPSSVLDNIRQEGDSAEIVEEVAPTSESAKAEEIDALSWTVKEGELISGKSKTTGPGNQSVVQYQRPLGDGESLSYEFYYEAGKTEVHPAIGRSAFILRPDGLKLHWMTEANTSWRTPADYEIPVPGVAAAPLPLKSGEWNQLKLERSGQTLTITLNDEKILQQPVELAQGEVFGLFHYADKTSVRVRNARLEGNWRKELPDKPLSTGGR